MLEYSVQPLANSRVRLSAARHTHTLWFTYGITAQISSILGDIKWRISELLTYTYSRHTNTHIHTMMLFCDNI